MHGYGSSYNMWERMENSFMRSNMRRNFTSDWFCLNSQHHWNHLILKLFSNTIQKLQIFNIKLLIKIKRIKRIVPINDLQHLVWTKWKKLLISHKISDFYFHYKNFFELLNHHNSNIIHHNFNCSDMFFYCHIMII